MANEYKLQLPNINPAVILEDVVARKGNKAVWPVLMGVSIAQVEIPVGKWRAPHYHTNAPELSVIIQGTARAGLITPQNDLIVVELQEGDCVYFPKGWTHWLRNTGNMAVTTYFNYGHEQPNTVEVSNIIAHFNALEKELQLDGLCGQELAAVADYSQASMARREVQRETGHHIGGTPVDYRRRGEP